ncbi:MAG TPA: hypothetical protein VGF92_21890 [Stellaceae bacterium]|jgi:hypothetical protein
MATKPSISHIKRGASALTSEAGKLIRDRALSAAHQALVVALQTVQAADRKLRGTSSTPRRKAARTIRANAKRKTTRAGTKARRAVATTTRPAKTAVRRTRRAAR